MRALLAGDTISRGDASIRVLWPAQQRPLAAFPSNDDSLVMRISAPGMSHTSANDQPLFSAINVHNATCAPF